MHKFHFTEQAAWDMPLIRAFAYCAWSTQNNGTVSVEPINGGYIAREQQNLKR